MALPLTFSKAAAWSYFGMFLGGLGSRKQPRRDTAEADPELGELERELRRELATERAVEHEAALEAARGPSLDRDPE